MRRITAGLRGLLLALVALCAPGTASHAQAQATPDGHDATASHVGADARPQDHIDRSFERPLPFLAGQGALETLLEINPRVNLRATGRPDQSIDDGSDARPAALSQLRVRLALWQHAATDITCAFASNGTLHSFSTPPPAPRS
ncbi:MAG TPA: hypothetical protein VFU06_16265 [Longimicrobiales bacterium]|nr:hypothetical protein [Longimicrobiales bacterium]